MNDTTQPTANAPRDTAPPPATMRVAELRDVDDLRIVERPTPRLEPGDLLVKIAASGICSGDLMPWYIRRKAPLVLGHEPAGTIVALGAGVASADRAGRPFRVGDRIAIHHHAPCFACRFCAREDFVQCAQWKKNALDPGGIAEYVRVPRAHQGDVAHLPDDLGWDEAVLFEPLGCVMKSLRRARLRGGDVVYVVGSGVMGLLHVAVLRSRGHRVVASDFLAERRAVAERLGAIAVAPDDAARALETIGAAGGADVAICGPGSPAALEHAIARTAPAGTVVMFTPLEPGTPFVFDQSSAYFRDLTLVASYSCGPNDTAEALAWLANAQLTAKDFGATRYAFEDTAEAYTRMAATDIVKAIVRFF